MYKEFAVPPLNHLGISAYINGFFYVDPLNNGLRQYVKLQLQDNVHH